MRKNLRERLNNNLPLSLFLALAGAILFYMLFNQFDVIRQGISIVLPVLLGAFLAFLLYGPQRFAERTIFRKLKKEKLRRVLSVVLVFLLMMILLALLTAVVVPSFFRSVLGLVDNIDNYAETLKKTVGNLAGRLRFIEGTDWYRSFTAEDTDWKQIAEKVLSWTAEHRDGIVGFSLNLGSGVVKGALALVFCLYIMLDSNHLIRAFSRFNKAMMSPERYEKMKRLTAHSGNVFRRYFLANLTDSLIIGVLTFLFLTVMKVPYSMLVTLIVAATNLVPTFGPVVGGGISAVLILFIKPETVIWFLVYTVVSQLLDSFLIKPLLFGSRTGLRPMWVLAATVVGGGLFGVWGMLLGIPVAAICSDVLEERIREKLRDRGYDENGTPLPPKPEQ